MTEVMQGNRAFRSVTGKVLSLDLAIDVCRVQIARPLPFIRMSLIKEKLN